MPNRLRVSAIAAELVQLDNLLDSARSADDFIGEFQLQIRKEQLQEELAGLRAPGPQPANVALFFGGSPVFGSRGIETEFAGKALQNFQEIVAKRHATNNLGSLAQRGQVPLADDSKLMITGVAAGSFGFVLEELTDQMEMFETPLKEAVDFAVEAIVMSGAEQITEYDTLVADIDERTLAALKSFFRLLDTKGAVVRLVDNERDVALSKEAVRRGRQRTEETTINEETTPYEGELDGFLPKQRRFEMTLTDGTQIAGSVDPDAVAQFKRLQEANEINLGTQVQVKLVVRSVMPSGRPQKTYYTLAAFENSDKAEE